MTTINLWDTHFMMKGAGGVNCYMVDTGAGFILIDSGLHSRRADLVSEIENLGCQPGDLRLIIITHADLDHTGNARFLRQKFASKIATHRLEAEAVAKGNMALDRKYRPGLISRGMLSLIGWIGRSDRFEPDVFLEDGDDLSVYGWDARVLHIPGHSMGSIGVLTASGDLYCGDLLWNIDKPEPQSNLDDQADWDTSFEKIKGLNIHTVYPGHGKPFLMEKLIDGYSSD